MGAQNSSFRRCIVDEYQRLKKDGRDFLVMGEIMQLKLPRSQWSVNLKHLSIMFVIDRNKDGRFSSEELQAFYDLACERARVYQTYEYMSMMHGYCTLLMWRAVSGANGHQEFANWFAAPCRDLFRSCLVPFNPESLNGSPWLVCRMTRLISENMETVTFEQYPGTTYLNRDSIETLHHVLGIKDSQGLDFQSFFDLLQRAGEEKGLMDLDNEELDDFLPLSIAVDFALSMIGGMQKVIGDIYPANEVQRMEL